MKDESGFGGGRVGRRAMFKGAAAAGVVGAAAVGVPALRPAATVRAQSVAEQIAQERGLTPEDVTAALKTYMPSGKLDEYYFFASGGHSGQVLVYGLPSMRLLRVIAVFTPEPWQGFGFSEGTKNVLDGGKVDGEHVTYGDSHHPGLSETNGEYDGQFLFIGDKAHARIAVIDLRDFETKQIVKNPHVISSHGASFVTPNTEYVIEGSQYASSSRNSVWGSSPPHRT